MIKNMQINGRQMYWLLISNQMVMTILLTIAPGLNHAKQNAWFSILISTAVGAGIAYLCSWVCMRYPGKTLAEFSCEILGKSIGKVITFAYLAEFLLTLSFILRQYGDFIIGTILPRTPIFAAIVLMICTVLYLSIHGIGGIGRCSEIVGPFLLLGFLLPVLLSIGKIKLEYLLPVLTDANMSDIITGALPASTFLGDCMLIFVIGGFVDGRNQWMKNAIWGVVSTGLLTAISTIIVTCVFTQEVGGSFAYPFLMLVRSVTIYGFIENLDVIAISIWIMSIFVKLCVYLFVCSYTASQLFQIRKWVPLCIGVAAIASILAMLPRNYVEASVIFPFHVGTRWIFPIFMIGIPCILWLVSFVRLRSQKV
ncbi:GerAB/ArcD/ProY family transporter [Paenibacillus aestuarii]|uniref:Endospore germination permease n=1 Tax=Paenibacillus aestuarii TaxID=516965 RepID=A0ABW0K6V7_9BACL|nr:endospore germination permease [Paenibacillus aestuarii]